MRFERGIRAVLVGALVTVSAQMALHFGSGGLWKGLGAAQAVTAGKADPNRFYDLTQLSSVNETLRKIRGKYVEPDRVQPRQMLLGALDQIQREVAQVIVTHDKNSPHVSVRIEDEVRSFQVDNVQGVWDVSARLREVFKFLQDQLSHSDVDLREVEYAACNGMLRTLDPHSVFLTPDALKEMTTSTSGHFGGLGIVISVRDRMLTIMRPMPDTPAGRHGILRYDRITKINNESTLNMPLEDAVKRLRGEPGSKVTLWIHRDGKDGWEGSRAFELTREEISIKSVDSKDLGGGIGYIRMKQFQASTADELHSALGEFHKAGAIKGLVLDMRNNPGGLLDQAVRVVDTFLSSGVVVSTVGSAEGRDESEATRVGTEPNYPIVVLVNSGSASASEIVAGALKNQNRAVIVGQATFGKGSVQVIYGGVGEGAALKLTIAQYLTPGDISIQGVGVSPDIELQPMTVDPLEMDLFGSEHRPRERDLNHSLTSKSVRGGERASQVLRYDLSQNERQELRELGGEIDDRFRLDFPLQFSRDLVAQMQQGTRGDQLNQSAKFVTAQQDQQNAKVTAQLKTLKIDYSTPPTSAKDGNVAKDFTVELKLDRKDNQVTAGESLLLTAKVKNNGSVPVYRLHGITKSDNAAFEEKELVFGKLEPGEEKEVSIPLGFCETVGRKPNVTKKLPLDAPRECTIPKESVSREDFVRVHFASEIGGQPKDSVFSVKTVEVPRPSFAYNYRVADDRKGNGNGLLERGEQATVYLSVQNVGKGVGADAEALLRNLSGDGLMLNAGRLDLSGIKPGERRDVKFTFDVSDSLRDDEIELDISMVDHELHVQAGEKFKLPVSKTAPPLKENKRSVLVKEDSRFYGSPMMDAPVIAKSPAQTVLRAIGEVGEFTKVEMAPAQFAYLPTKHLSDTKQASKANALKELVNRAPPELDIQVPSLATRSHKMELTAIATDMDGVADAYVYHGNKKVLFRSNRAAKDPTQLELKIPLELNPGLNIVTVIARQSDDVTTIRSIVVRRDGPNGEAMPTPKGVDFGADWEFNGDD